MLFEHNNKHHHYNKLLFLKQILRSDFKHFPLFTSATFIYLFPTLCVHHKTVHIQTYETNNDSDGGQRWKWKLRLWLMRITPLRDKCSIIYDN